MKFKIYIFSIALVYFTAANAQNFTSPNASTGYTTTITGFKQGSISPIDIDNDGKMDLIINGYDALFNSFSKLYYNTGTEFSDMSAFITFPGVGSGKTLVGDVNNDGSSDLLFIGEFAKGQPTSPTSTLIAKLYTFNGSNFTEVMGTPFVGAYGGDAAFADVNNDGFLDVLIIGDETAGNNINTAKLYTNTGGNFTLVAGTPFTGAKTGGLAFADVNNDTYKDVIITGLQSPGNSFTKLYTNSGTNFTEVAGTPFPAVSGSKVAFLDANGDNKPDVFIMGSDNSFISISKLYTNSGTNFTEVPTPAITPVNSGDLVIADFNNDNKPDLYLSGSDDSFTNTIKLYTNTGGNFAEVATPPFASDFTETIVAAFDINNDGKKDIIATGGAAGSGNNLAKIYFNIANTQITAQPISATVCGGTLHTVAVTATGTGLTYLWSNGATTQTINTSQAGTYQVTVIGLGGTAVSNAANLVVNAATQITQQPSNQAICGTQVATLSVSGTGTNISYLWSNGATTPSIVTTTKGTYFGTVTGLCGSVVSNAAIVSAGAATTITAISATDNAVGFGSTTSISVIVPGTGLSYLWSNGGTSSTFTTSIAGEYFVTVTGTCGTADTSITIGNVVLASENSGYTFQNSFGSKGSQLEQFDHPAGIGVDSDGRVYVAEVLNNRVVVYTKNGNSYTASTSFGTVGAEINEFDSPFGVYVAPDGKIYVTDTHNHRVSVWTRNGTSYTPFATFGSIVSIGSSDNQFYFPRKTFVGPDGKIYVSDQGNDRISVWSLNNGTYTHVTNFGSYGSANNQLNAPSGVFISMIIKYL